MTALDQDRRRPWPAIAAARAHDPARRVPFLIGGRTVGSVARAHLGALRRWPDALAVGDDRVALTVPGASARDAALAAINDALRGDGLIVGWRDETFPIFDPATHERLARTERAAARFWGTLTLGAHANGYIAGADGRPTHLWIAQRSFDKATDPGMYDNLVGGGVPDGQTPLQALVREAWEEAGLTPQQVQGARAGRVIRLRRDIAEGLQLEDVHGHDLPLPAGLVPVNQDGEVERFLLLNVDDALDLAAGSSMTVDAALVTLDFALRHGLLAAPPAAARLVMAP
jgi:8-oxo-dGTP pyrophosphatase MutT (NUDIX family)